VPEPLYGAPGVHIAFSGHLGHDNQCNMPSMPTIFLFISCTAVNTVGKVPRQAFRSPKHVLYWPQQVRLVQAVNKMRSNVAEAMEMTFID
jgi:hypothetical protein